MRIAVNSLWDNASRLPPTAEVLGLTLIVTIPEGSVHAFHVGTQTGSQEVRVPKGVKGAHGADLAVAAVFALCMQCCLN